MLLVVTLQDIVIQIQTRGMESKASGNLKDYNEIEKDLPCVLTMSINFYKLKDLLIVGKLNTRSCFNTDCLSIISITYWL